MGKIKYKRPEDFFSHRDVRLRIEINEVYKNGWGPLIKEVGLDPCSQVLIDGLVKKYGVGKTIKFLGDIINEDRMQ